MNFRDKFDKMIDIIEENVEKESREVAEIIGNEFGIYRRTANETFLFITSTAFSDYVRGRKHKRIIDEVIAQKGTLQGVDVIAEIACKYGYSDRSSFDRAFKRDYDVTPASVINKNTPYNYTERLSLDAILENDMETGFYQGRVDEKTTATVINDLTNSGAMIINLENEQDRVLLNEIMDCQALYGLSTEQVLLAYELSDDKSSKGLNRACEAISFGCKNLRVDEINDEFRDALYLVVNNNLFFEEAEKIVSDIRNGSNVDVRRLDKTYLELVVKYNYIDGCILENLPYDLYVRKHSFICSLANKAMDLDNKQIKKGKFAIRKDILFIACLCLASNFSRDEIESPTKDIKKQMDLLLASTRTMCDMTRGKAITILNDLKSMNINNWRKCGEEYIDIMFSHFESGNLLPYSSYLELVKDLKEYGVTDPDDIKEVVVKTTEHGWDLSFEETVDDILYKRKLAKEYGLVDNVIEELEELCNYIVTIEDACKGFVQSTGKRGFLSEEMYKSSLQHLTDTALEKQRALFCTPGEKLALLMSLNSTLPYEMVKERLIKEFSDAGMDFDLSDDLYYEIMRIGAFILSYRIKESIDKTESYNVIPFSDYLRLYEIIPPSIKRREDLIYFAAVAYFFGVYPTLEECGESIMGIAEKIDGISDEGRMNREIIVFDFVFDESLAGKKPHTIEPEELKKRIQVEDYDYQDGIAHTAVYSAKMRELADMWGPALGWSFSGSVTRGPLD